MASTFDFDPDRCGYSNPFVPNQRLIVGVLTTDGGDGAAAGDIAASLFGLTIIDEVEPLVKDDNTLIVVAAPAYAGTSLLGKAAATAAPADIPSGNYLVRLKGR